jgi:uncharacterized protein (DUF433 family)
MPLAPEPLITTSPDRLGGTPVLAGTCVPVQTLIDYLEAGDSLDVFLAQFPSVTREHAVAVLELAKGVMDLRAMAVVAAAITVERLAPAGERVAHAIGAVVVGAGLFLIARATGLG